VAVTDDWNPNDPDATRVVYDLSAWSFDQQAELASELAEAEVPHTWDGSDLMVPVAAEQAADLVIDTLEERFGISYDDDEAEAEGDGEPAQRIDISDDEPSTEYELADWSQDDRESLTGALVTQARPFRWEGDTLLVPTTDEAVVEALLDLVEAGESAALEVDPEHDAVDDPEADDGDPLPFETLTTFFLAGERLKKNPLDADGLEQLLAAVEVAEPNKPPYGVDVRLWQRTCELADELAGALVDDELPDGDTAMSVAEELHDLLRPYI
jgi:hypothetical protein